MTEQELDSTKPWEAFSKRYPLIASNSRFIRIVTAIFCKSSTKEVWENGYYLGIKKGLESKATINYN